MTDRLLGRYLAVLESMYYIAVHKHHLVKYGSTDELIDFCTRFVRVINGLSSAQNNELLILSDSYISSIKIYMGLLGRYSVRIETYGAYVRIKRPSGDCISPAELSAILRDSIDMWEAREETGATAFDHLRYRLLGSMEPIATDDSGYTDQVNHIKEILTGKVPNPGKGWVVRECDRLLENLWEEKEAFRELGIGFEAISALLGALNEEAAPEHLPLELSSLGAGILALFASDPFTEPTASEVAASLDKVSAALGESAFQESASNVSKKDSFDTLLKDCTAELEYYPKGLAGQWIRRIKL